MAAEPASEAASNLRREPSSDTRSDAGELVASVSLSGMMKGNPEVRASVYPSEERWVLEKIRGDRLAAERSERVPNEWFDVPEQQIVIGLDDPEDGTDVDVNYGW